MAYIGKFIGTQAQFLTWLESQLNKNEIEKGVTYVSADSTGQIGDGFKGYLYHMEAFYANTEQNLHYFLGDEMAKLVVDMAGGSSTQIQSDWNQTDNTKVDFIKNKPTIPDAQIQSDWGQTNDEAKDYIKNKPNLATVATSGSYTDLSNTPTIPDAQIQSDWNQSDNTAKDYIKNKPSIPAAQVQANWNESDSSSMAFIQNKPDLSTSLKKQIVESLPVSNIDLNTIYMILKSPAGASGNIYDEYMYINNDWEHIGDTQTTFTQTQANWNESNQSSVAYIQNKPNLATVATSGSYNDLSGKPTIPDAQIQSDWNQADNTAKDYIKNKPTIPVLPQNIVTGESAAYTIWVGTQADYDLILTPSSTTVYLIKAS